MLKFPHTAGSSAPPAQHILTQYVCVLCEGDRHHHDCDCIKAAMVTIHNYVHQRLIFLINRLVACSMKYQKRVRNGYHLSPQRPR